MLIAAFLQPIWSHWFEMAVGISLFAAVSSTVLQLSKSRVERGLITSAITASSPMNVAPIAVRTIGTGYCGNPKADHLPKSLY